MKFVASILSAGLNFFFFITIFLRGNPIEDRTGKEGEHNKIKNIKSTKKKRVF